MFERVSYGGMLEKGIMELLYQLVNYSECSQHCLQNIMCSIAHLELNNMVVYPGANHV